MNVAKLGLALLLAVGCALRVQAVVVDFVDLAAGSFNVGGSFNSTGIEFDVIAYNGPGSQVFVQKSGTPTNTLLFSGNSVGFTVALPADTGLIAFDFGDFCTGCSATGITVNGAASSPTVQLTDLHGTTLGGAAINVVSGPARIHHMTLTGPITTFTIGGTELQLDNLRIAIPEPGTILLLGASFMAFCLRRH